MTAEALDLGGSADKPSEELRRAMTDSTPPSIRDIAKAAGVSIATVSLSLNGKGRISPETRRRVIATARRLNYHANIHAQTLPTGRSRILAVQISAQKGQTVVPRDLGYFAAIINGASRRAHSLGYLVTLVPAESERGLRGLDAGGGLVVDPDKGSGLLHLMHKLERPVVTIGRSGGEQTDKWVDNDHRAGVQKLLDHLRSRGYARVALLTPASSVSYVEDVTEGYEAWMHRESYPITVARAKERSPEAAARIVGQLLRQEEPPDAVCATSDLHAIGALRAAMSAHLDVPSDIAVVSYVDSDVVRTASPAITALEVFPERIGEEAVSSLVSSITGEHTDSIGVVVPTRLLPRISTLGKGSSKRRRSGP